MKTFKQGTVVLWTHKNFNPEFWNNIGRTMKTQTKRQRIPVIKCGHPRTIEIADGTKICTVCEAVVQVAS